MAHGDYTGNSKAALAQQFAKQQQLAAQHTSLVSQVVSENRQQNINLFNEVDNEALHLASQPREEGDGVQEFEPGDTSLLQPVKFQAGETVEDVTVGKDRSFNLESGQVYTAPLWVVQHLDEKSLVRH